MFKTFKDADSHLGNRDRRKLANNTYLERRGENRIAVILHETDILTFTRDGYLYFNSGGWRTVTTKDRMNGFQKRARVYSHKGAWFVSDGKWDAEKREEFADGFKIGPRGAYYRPSGSPDTAKLRRRILEYAADFETAYEAGEIPLPGSGDCWFCLFADKQGAPWGDGQTDHLTSHLDEKYYVPALLRNAMKWGQVGDIKYYDWQQRVDVNTHGVLDWHWVKKLIAKYLYRQFGV
jgi:hypothetical protein